MLWADTSSRITPALRCVLQPISRSLDDGYAQLRLHFRNSRCGPIHRVIVECAQYRPFIERSGIYMDHKHMNVSCSDNY